MTLLNLIVQAKPVIITDATVNWAAKDWSIESLVGQRFEIILFLH